MLQHDYKGEKQTSYPSKFSLLKHFTGNKIDLKNETLGNLILFFRLYIVCHLKLTATYSIF